MTLSVFNKYSFKEIGTKNESGNIAFYVAFVIPISLVLIIIVIDISQWQFLREEAQREVDRVALEVANYLPYDQLSKEYAQQRINNFNESSERLKISPIFSENGVGAVNADTVTLEIRGTHESVTDSLLSAVTGREVVLDVQQISSARVVPYDALIVFSDAASMRPPAFITYGSEQEYPASEYFNLIGQPRIRVSPPPTAPRAWPDWWNVEVFNSQDFKRWSTQLCFNPMTLPLKQSLLMLVDQFSASRRNKIGVYASPGDTFQGVGFSVIKEFSFPDSQQNPVRWSTYFEPDVPLSDEACLLYSHEEIGMNTYRIPDLQNFSSEADLCETIIARNPFSSPNGHYPNPLSSALSSCFREQGGAKLRDAIYYHAVRMHPHEAQAANISRALSSALSRLVEDEKKDTQDLIGMRGGLTSKTNKLLILISDSLPETNDPAIQEVLRFIDNSEHFSLYALAYNHSGLSIAQKSNNSSIIQSYLSLGKNRLRGIVVDETSISNEINALLLNEKRVVISS